MPQNNVFVRVTNGDIYAEIRKTHDDLLEMISKQKGIIMAVKGLFMFDLALLSGLIYVALS